MWLAFIIALTLELLKKAENVITAVKYVIASVILSTIVGFAFAFIAPTQAEAVAIQIYLFITTISAILGFVTAKILRAIAGVK